MDLIQKYYLIKNAMSKVDDFLNLFKQDVGPIIQNTDSHLKKFRIFIDHFNKNFPEADKREQQRLADQALEQLDHMIALLTESNKNLESTFLKDD